MFNIYRISFLALKKVWMVKNTPCEHWTGVVVLELIKFKLPRKFSIPHKINLGDQWRDMKMQSVFDMAMHAVYRQFLITNYGFWLVTFLLGKCDALSKKINEKVKSTIFWWKTKKCQKSTCKH